MKKLDDELLQEILGFLKPFPSITTIQEIADQLGISYPTAKTYLFILSGGYMVAFVKRSGIKMFFKPPVEKFPVNTDPGNISHTEAK